ncbi:MAG TPA: cysteine peptidase family C39 domain-containing protein [Candidatus Paceibacterota bacterium]|nr:cysteine peptidase family C39 domain-containing protein [Candidatus Paceibacterota bacterium]
MHIPHRHQKNIHYCGPTVLQMALAAYGIKRTQDQLAKEAKTPVDMEHATEPKNLVSVLHSYGFAAEAKNNSTLAELKEALKKNRIVIICYSERFWRWDHYAIVSKITDQEVHLIDPQEKIGTTLKMKLEEFEENWHGKLFTKTKRWALFAAKPKTE